MDRRSPATRKDEKHSKAAVQRRGSRDRAESIAPKDAGLARKKVTPATI